MTLQQIAEFLSNLNESNPFGSEGISIKSKQLSFVIQKKRVETDDFLSAVKLHSTECARNFPIWNSTAPSVWKSKRIPRGAPPVFASFWRANDAHRPKYIDTRYTHTHTRGARLLCVCSFQSFRALRERICSGGLSHFNTRDTLWLWLAGARGSRLVLCKWWGRWGRVLTERKEPAAYWQPTSQQPANWPQAVALLRHPNMDANYQQSWTLHTHIPFSSGHLKKLLFKKKWIACKLGT